MTGFELHNFILMSLENLHGCTCLQLWLKKVMWCFSIFSKFSNHLLSYFEFRYYIPIIMGRNDVKSVPGQ